MLLSTIIQAVAVSVFCRCAADDRLGKVSVDPDEVSLEAGLEEVRSNKKSVRPREVLFQDEVPEIPQTDSEVKLEDLSNGRIKLFQYDPVQVGHVQYVSDELGRIMELITAAVDPPVFEIRNFVTDEECDHIVKLALESGLEPSGVIMELLPSLSDGNEEEILNIFGQLDIDESSYLDPVELADGLMDVAGGMLSKDDVTILMTEFKMDSNGDEHLDVEEFKQIWTTDMERSINQWVKNRLASNDTSFHFSNTRVSDQAWLDQSWREDDTLIQLHERVVKLTQLPEDLVFSSESLQVVRYQPGGHYHAHFDSSDLDDTLLCAHTESFGMDEDFTYTGLDSEGTEPSDADEQVGQSSRLCRFATVLYYLNDVEDGGETAFPVADNETFSYEAVDQMPYDLYDLSYHCYDSNLVVKPEKGKAILWYNHMINKTTGWLGEIYNTSLHGGCDVRKGEKWIANNWINIDDTYTRQMDYHEYFKRELDISKKERDRDRFVSGIDDRDEQIFGSFTGHKADPDGVNVEETAFNERNRDEL